MKRYVSLIMALLVLLGCIFSTVSCKKDEENTDSTVAAGTEGELSKLKDHNFEGREITVLAREQFGYEIESAELTGEWINQLISVRNASVEGKYNVKLKVVLIPGIWENRTQYKTAIKTAVEAGGKCEYDIISGAQNQINSYVTEGMFANLHGNENINFDNKWWFDGFVDNMTINNKLYFTVGDVGVTLLENMNVVVFNKTLFDQNKISYPYELVRNDQWTLENLNEISKVYTCSDVNENNRTDPGDSFVLCGGGAKLRSITTSFDIKITSPDNMGLPEITMYNQRTVDIVDKFQSMLVSNSRAYFKDHDDDGSEVFPMEIFKDNRALMMFTLLSDVNELTASSVKFGIVPFPKYNADQENYYTHVYETLTVYTIPVNAGSQSESGLILEALGASSYDNVTEEYFEKVLSLQNSDDIDSLEMLAMARENISFNFGFVHSASIGDIGAVFDNIKLGNYNLTNRWELSEDSWNTALGRLLDKYLAMDGN
ncbi:MAG: extracellular solute-binding protein [Clostridia bacterium]|nr:extracellular solute-binding protein [Clostridia bacterium]